MPAYVRLSLFIRPSVSGSILRNALRHDFHMATEFCCTSFTDSFFLLPSYVFAVPLSQALKKSYTSSAPAVSAMAKTAAKVAKNLLFIMVAKLRVITIRCC